MTLSKAKTKLQSKRYWRFNIKRIEVNENKEKKRIDLEQFSCNLSERNSQTTFGTKSNGTNDRPDRY
jgi:hypothetical protein